MKRNLLESVRCFPYEAGQAFDRSGFLSAVLGIRVDTAGDDAAIKVTASHSDTEDGAYTPVLDERVFLEETAVTRSEKGRITEVSAGMPVSAGELVNLDIDLLGCKRYVKLDAAYTGGGDPAVSASCALVLGDGKGSAVL